MKKIVLILIGLGTLPVVFLALPHLLTPSTPPRPEPSAEVENLAGQAVPGVEPLSASGYRRLTNWLLTPLLRQHEGVIPWEAEQGIRRLGTNALPALLLLVRQGDTQFTQARGMAMVGFDVLGLQQLRPLGL